MGCIYCNYDGICQFFDEDEAEIRPNGCDNNGNCLVEDDPIPSESCEQYESNWMCYECGADFNADEECTCCE